MAANEPHATELTTEQQDAVGPHDAAEVACHVRPVVSGAGHTALRPVAGRRKWSGCSRDRSRYAFEFDRRYARAGRLFGVTPARAGIVVGDRQLRVRFGPWHVVADLDNIVSVAVTGPYAFLKTAGPARLGLTDRGLTFATNSRAGVCLEFGERITGVDPAGLIRHPNLTLTPADVAGLAHVLRR